MSLSCVIYDTDVAIRFADSIAVLSFGLHTGEKPYKSTNNIYFYPFYISKIDAYNYVAFKIYIFHIYLLIKKKLKIN